MKGSFVIMLNRGQIYITGLRYMKNKIIGLISAHIYEEDSVRIIEYIQMFARRYDYRVVNFVPGTLYKDGKTIEDSKSLYMLNFNKLDALIIDAEFFASRAFIDEIVDKAKKASLPCFILNEIYEDGISIISDDDMAFASIFMHFLGQHKAKKIAFVSEKDTALTNHYLDLYKKLLIESELSFEPNMHIRANQIEDIKKEDAYGAYICMEDASAYKLMSHLDSLGLSIPSDAIIAGLSGNVDSFYKKKKLTTCLRDRKAMCELTIKCIHNTFEEIPQDKIFKVPSETFFSDTCGCISSGRDDAADVCGRLIEQIDNYYKIDARLNNLADRLMDRERIEEVANVLNDVNENGCFICVRNSFMQDIFMDEQLPDGMNFNDSFYVIADSGKKKRLWKSFDLSELAPDLNKLLNKEEPVIILPITFGHVQYGYIVIHDKNFSEKCHRIEHFAKTLGSALNCYAWDKRIRFANRQRNMADDELLLLRDRDIFTGMFNSAGFYKQLEKVKEVCIDNDESLILMCFDIAGLGDINSIYGHSEGDEAIHTFGKILQENVTSDYICGHIGSDEFVIATHTAGNCALEIEAFLTALDAYLENYNMISSKEYSIKINQAYLTVQPDKYTDLKMFMDEAFARKSTIKQSKLKSGSSRPGVPSENISDEDRRNINVILDDNKLTYAFQPIVDARTGEIFAYEALMRTATPTPISPFKILEVASMDNRLYEIEYFTMFNVLKIVSENKDKFKGRKIFINSIPGYTLNKNDFSKLGRLYSNHFESMVVEITEQTELDEDSLNTFKTLHNENGFEIAIDDFGSGYANTSNLLRYIPNYVKIDRLLISNVDTDEKKQHFVKNIIEFAHDNGFKTLAEGVENEEELRAVIQMGVDLIQGYYTARPALDILDNLPKEVGDKIIACNLSNKNMPKRKIYHDNGEKQIFLMKLALEEYTDIVVSSPEVTIVGNMDYGAEIHIKVKDDIETTIRLREVNIRGANDLPCIDIGNNTKVTLILENDNELGGKGIRVPQGSKLVTAGDGNLTIFASDNRGYGIGNNFEEPFGEIVLGSDGELDISLIGDGCIGVGGGSGPEEGIAFVRGKYDIGLTGLRCIGIGTVTGMAKVNIKECSLEMSTNALECVCIGSLNGPQDVSIEDCKVVLDGEGKNTFCGIGSPEGLHGGVSVNRAHVMVSGKGKDVYLIGNCAGGYKVEFKNARFDLDGQGTNVVALGSYNMNGDIDLKDGLVSINIHADNPITFGAHKENIEIRDIVAQIQPPSTEIT